MTQLSMIDFSKNSTFEIQNEVQNMYWHSYQVTILMHITWWHNPNPIPNDEDSKVLMKYHFYINDDKTHDSYFVQHCLLLHWENMVDSGFQTKHHYMWSNGCSSQFKTKTSWLFVSCYPYLTKGCSLLWSFFGIGHGNEPHDGVGSMLKRFIQQSQLDVSRPKLQNAEDVVTLLHKHLNS